MLESLHIRDMAIIDDLVVGFQPGLNVLTGETGAGKSILIGAIQLLLGAKAGPELIREGAQEASVEGLWDLSTDERALRELKEKGFRVSGPFVLRRVVSKTGRSRAFLNGQMCAISMLAQLGRSWVNIYGQHEHQSLLQPERHLDLLDEHGRLMELRQRWEDAWRRWENLAQRISKARSAALDVKDRRELWEFQVAEIRAARLQAGEQEALEQERRVLLNAERVRSALERAEQSLYGEKGSATERVQLACRELSELARVVPALGASVESLNCAMVHLEEALVGIREQLRRIHTDEGRLLEVEERLEEIQRLRRKYRADVPGILALADQLAQRLQELDHGEGLLERLLDERDALERELVRVGLELREARLEAGRRLAAEVERELMDLGVEKPTFEVEVTALAQGIPLGGGSMAAGSRGLDSVEFKLSTNRGEPPKPLWRIASGGELSRIMLAMKKVLAEAERVPTLVLDEIDAGIGGAVAHALGQKLAHLGRSHQVLCVTHLPQVACFAGHHLRVSKELRGSRTVTVVSQLDWEDRVEELSRMLGGRLAGPKARAHARELLEKAAG